ncbi:hypothetical protein AADZ90_001530 [Aestuariibius sp. 2305UL40-4]|uniref:hypothetical protein n=1 Tax=Aestuariibius violaceus TaxID=3234132 RepID=UPI00345F026A
MPLLILCGLGAGLVGAVGAWMVFGASFWAILLGYVLLGSLGVGAAGLFIARKELTPARETSTDEAGVEKSEDDRLERI